MSFDEKKFRELHAAGALDSEIGKLLGMSKDQVRHKRSRLGLPANFKSAYRDATLTRVISESPDRTVYAAEETEEEPFDELLGRALKATDRAMAKAKSKRFCLSRIISDKPIAVVFPSDQHLTMSGATNVRRAFEDAAIIRDTPGLYAVLGGDGIDNHIKHRGAMAKKASAPNDEYRLYDGYLKTLGLKTLAAVGGNHDAEWNLLFTGLDAVGQLIARHRIHYALASVMMDLRIVSDVDDEGVGYGIKLRHRYRFNSQINLIHAVHRMYDMDGDQFDIGVVCHNHEAAKGTFNRHGQVRYAIRPGSYQIQTDHGVAEGYSESFPTCPGVVLWPKERRIEDFDDLRNVVERLEAARR